MLTDRQLADIQADVTETLTNPKADPSMRLLARHCQYMLDELNARKETVDLTPFQSMTDADLAKLERWDLPK